MCMWSRGTRSVAVIRWWTRNGIRAEVMMYMWLRVLAQVQEWNALTTDRRAVRALQLRLTMMLVLVSIVLMLL